MPAKIVPMIHVPDIRATAAWYVSIGFTLARFNEEDGEMNWALLEFGGSEIMLNIGGKPSQAQRREFDLYIHADEVDALYAEIKDKAETVEAPRDTFYGMREFIIRDFNRFWLTFGQPMRS